MRIRREHLHDTNEQVYSRSERGRRRGWRNRWKKCDSAEAEASEKSGKGKSKRSKRRGKLRFFKRKEPKASWGTLVRKDSPYRLNSFEMYPSGLGTMSESKFRTRSEIRAELRRLNGELIRDRQAWEKRSRQAEARWRKEEEQQLKRRLKMIKRKNKARCRERGRRHRRKKKTDFLETHLNESRRYRETFREMPSDQRRRYRGKKTTFYGTSTPLNKFHF